MYLVNKLLANIIIKVDILILKYIDILLLLLIILIGSCSVIILINPKLLYNKTREGLIFIKDVVIILLRIVLFIFVIYSFNTLFKNINFLFESDKI